MVSLATDSFHTKVPRRCDGSFWFIPYFDWRLLPSEMKVVSGEKNQIGDLVLRTFWFWKHSNPPFTNRLAGVMIEASEQKDVILNAEMSCKLS